MRYKCLSILLILAILFTVSGCGSAPAESGKDGDTAEIKPTPSEKLENRKLKLSVLNYQKKGPQTIALDDGNYPAIQVWDLDEVTIELDGKVLPIEEALKSGAVSVEEMIAWARLDASRGICTEAASSQNGLTEFTYHYPEFSLHCVYDIYETPDGKQHLIRDAVLYGAGSEPSFSYSWDESGAPIDYEDWGLRFEVQKAARTGLTIICTQSGGQQLGNLKLKMYLLNKVDAGTSEMTAVQPLDGKEIPDTAAELTMGGTTQILLDFTEVYGELPAGDYELDMQIIDQYDSTQKNTLMRKFHDQQWYRLEFTVQ